MLIHSSPVQRGKGVYRAEQIRTRWRHVTSRPKQPSSAEYTPLPLRRHYSTPEGLVRLQENQQQHNSAQDERFVRLTASNNTDSSPGLSSEEPSPTHAYRIRSYSLSVKDRRLQVEAISIYGRKNAFITEINVLSGGDATMEHVGWIDGVVRIWNGSERNEPLDSGMFGGQRLLRVLAGHVAKRGLRSYDAPGDRADRAGDQQREKQLSGYGPRATHASRRPSSANKQRE